MTDVRLTTIEFHGATLIARPDVDPAHTLVAMKTIVEGIGLDWGGQYVKLREHPVLAPTIEVIPIVAEDGRLRSMIAIPLTRLGFWLATIQPNKVPDLKVRERVIAYQNECADALFNHFFGKEPAPSLRRTDRYASAGAGYNDDELVAETPESLKLQKVNTACRVFGQRAAAQVWFRENLGMVPAMAAALAQLDFFDDDVPARALNKNGKA